jgi:hypothetical protein
MSALSAVWAVTLAMLATLLLVTGCGDEGGGGTTMRGSSRPAEPRASNDGAKEFRIPGGDNSIQEFGSEARSPELRAAAVAFHGFFGAQARQRWAAACGYLAAGIKWQLAQLASEAPEAGGADCASMLETLTAGVPVAVLREAAIAEVGALRVEGSRGYLLYRGAHGEPYAIQMAREGGVWKVAGVSSVPLE